jgi:hypothetical protein
MGKKRRYRKFPHKFGRKCALKYGLNKEDKTLAEEVNSTPAPVIMVAPEPIVEEPVVVAPEPAKVTITAEPVEKPPKKKAAPKKSATTTRKTTRKRTTKAKTTT